MSSWGILGALWGVQGGRRGWGKGVLGKFSKSQEREGWSVQAVGQPLFSGSFSHVPLLLWAASAETDAPAKPPQEC